MYKNILIATDGSSVAASAAQQGISLAKSEGAKVTAVSVAEPYHWFSPGTDPAAVTAYTDGVKQAAARALTTVADAAAAAGVACETLQLEDQHPYKAIIAAAGTKNCDLIVMGSHGRGTASAIVLGSESNKVLAHSKIPVLVCR